MLLASSKKSPENEEEQKQQTSQIEADTGKDDKPLEAGTGTTPVPEKPPVKLKSKLNLSKLREAVEKKNLETEEEIPDFLYTPGTRSHEAAKIMVFEGISDSETISKRTGLAKKTAGMIRRAVFKAAEDLREAQKQASSTEDRQDKQDREDRQSMIHTLHKGNQGGVPVLPATDASHKPARLTTPEESTEKKRIVMYPYKMPNGTTMYFPTRVGDIKEHEGGELGVNDLLIKSGFIAPEEIDPTVR